MSTAPTYPVDTIAKLLLLTPRRVQQLSADGVIPRAERGRYELAPAVQGYIRFLQERHLGAEGDDGGDATLAAEKLKKLAAERQMKEMERDEMAGTLQHRGAVAKVYGSRVAAARAKMLAIPKKLAPQLVDMSDPVEVETLIKAEVYAALRELGTPAQSEADAGQPTSAGEPGADSGGAGEGGEAVPGDGGSAVAPAAGMDGQPVG
ncbi:MAG: putative terminase small subunit, Nu1 [Planctomycetota bacterium]